MRTLRLTSPYAQGADVRALQRALNKIERDHPHLARTDVDGQYGPVTAHRTVQVAYLLGIGRKHIDGGVKPWVQRLILTPTLRNPVQRVRSRKRWKVFKAKHKGVDGVLSWHKARVGTTEQPFGSNRGPLVSKWEKDFGMDGQPWCGAYACYPLRHIAGIALPNGVVFTPNIYYWAKMGTNGFEKLVSWDERRPGDLPLYKWPGVSSNVCDHVGTLDHDRHHTYEGNTSSGNVGSQNNGGGVYHRDRGPANCVGLARPRWH